MMDEYVHLDYKQRAVDPESRIDIVSLLPNITDLNHSFRCDR